MLALTSSKIFPFHNENFFMLVIIFHDERLIVFLSPKLGDFHN